MGIDFSGGELLTDDKPKMEFIHQPVIENYREEGLQNSLKTLIVQGIKLF